MPKTRDIDAKNVALEAPPSSFLFSELGNGGADNLIATDFFFL